MATAEFHTLPRRNCPGREEGRAVNPPWLRQLSLLVASIPCPSQKASPGVSVGGQGFNQGLLGFPLSEPLKVSWSTFL